MTDLLSMEQRQKNNQSHDAHDMKQLKMLLSIEPSVASAAYMQNNAL
jgi:hypothetical protein